MIHNILFALGCGREAVFCDVGKGIFRRPTNRSSLTSFCASVKSAVSTVKTASDSGAYI